MRLDGSNAQNERVATGRVVLFLCALALGAFLTVGVASASAVGVSLDTPLVGVDVDLDENGAGVGVDVPVVETEIDADVSTGEGSVDVNVGVGSPSSNSNSGAGESGSGGGTQSRGDSSSGGESGSSQPRGGETSNNLGSPAAVDRARPGGPATSRSTRQPSASPPGSDRGSAAQANGLVGLVVASSRTAPASRTEPTQPEVSVVAQLVEYIPRWLWVALGLLVLALLATAAYALRERSRRRAEHEMAMHDPLTGVANVKAFEARLRQEWDRAQRYGGNLGVLMIDLDRFKAVNDEHGHATGDEVLIATGNELCDLTRTTDLVARVGGDEFAIICPETSLRGLKKMRNNLERKVPPAAGFGVGVSIGAAERSPGDTMPSEMLARADLAMYDRKSGRSSRGESEVALPEAV